MLHRASLFGALMLAGAGRPLLGQSTDHPSRGAGQDSGFAALQARGKVAMGVDQYTSRHRFDDFQDGGRIELQTDSADTAGVRAIRDHLLTITRAFAACDFGTPSFVHAGEVPGTKEMAALRAHIKYRFSELPGGGQVRILTTNSDALTAVHSFLEFQRQQHGVGETHLHR